MASNPADELRVALRRAGFPAIGVSMGDPTNRQTWQVQYVPPLESDQAIAVQAFLAAYDPIAEATARDDAATARALTDDLVMGAIVRWVAQRLGVPWAQAVNEIQRLARRPRGGI